MTSDATHVYRGYRLQALYSLYRILKDSGPTNLVFQPEGAEDLSVLDENGSMVEVCQIKAYRQNLTLSDFKPDKRDSFFYRIQHLLAETPNLTVTIVSYSDAPELQKAIEIDGPDRQNVATKLGSFRLISDINAKTIIGKMNIQIIDENSMSSLVYDILSETLVGIDPRAAFDLLSFWLYLCAEGKREISRHDVINQINGVGNFLADRAIHLREWGTAIIPIEDQEITDDEILKRLGEEFYMGISADYSHILAGLDVVRTNRLEEIRRKFKRANTVIIHGASGQGKTALAYRYMHEYYPSHWRFKIRLIESRQHAIRIATALTHHANAIGIPLLVYIDVSYNDRDWPELVQTLSAHNNIRVLVTIREEDFRRATFSGASLRFEEIYLILDKIEARQIYQALSNKCVPEEFLDFEEAWNRFGDDGPLLEFAYLVNHGTTLKERLREQVIRLKDEVRLDKLAPAELALLRIVSVAAAYEARLNIRSLVASLGLASPERTLELFEKEYLLRLKDDGTLVGGLHPIRSQILADFLTDPGLYPWCHSAEKALLHVNELDMETFLLYAFSRRPPDAKYLFDSLINIHAENWTVIAGVTRSLIWLGVREYVTDNRELIEDLYKEAGLGGLFMLDFDIAGVMSEPTFSLWETMSSMIDNERRLQIEQLRSRQTNKERVFFYAKEWLAKRARRPVVPRTDSEWVNMAEILFWAKRLGITWPLAKWLQGLPFNDVVETLPLNDLANLSFGLFIGHPEFFLEWMTNNRMRLVERFRRATKTFALEDDGKKVTASFLVQFEPEYDMDYIMKRVMAAKNRLHEEAIMRLQLMRGLFPDRMSYACQGYGHRVLPEFNSQYDSTEKTGVDQMYLPPFWLTHVNGFFRVLAQQYFRPQTWTEFSEIIIDIRRNVLAILTQLTNAIEEYYRTPDEFQFRNAISLDLWDRVVYCLKHPPLFPSCALDEWGFMDESTSDEAQREIEYRGNRVYRRSIAALHRQPYSQAQSDFIRPLSNFFTQSVQVLAWNPTFRKLVQTGGDRKAIMKMAEEQQGIQTNLWPLSTLNLADAVKSLVQMQIESRILFDQSHMNRQEICELERKELKCYWRAWNLWYIFESQPEGIFVNLDKLSSQIAAMDVDLRRGFQKEIGKLSDESARFRIASETVPWEGQPALWITIDGNSATNAYSASDKLPPALL